MKFSTKNNGIYDTLCFRKLPIRNIYTLHWSICTRQPGLLISEHVTQFWANWTMELILECAEISARRNWQNFRSIRHPTDEAHSTDNTDSAEVRVLSPIRESLWTRLHLGSQNSKAPFQGAFALTGCPSFPLSYRSRHSALILKDLPEFLLSSPSRGLGRGKRPTRGGCGN